MSSQFIIITYVLAVGFVLAGLLNAVHVAIMPNGEDENGHFLLYFDTPLATIWSIIICIFAGPYLVAKNGLRFWTKGLLPNTALVMCGIVTLVWSFCSGIIIVETAISLGILVV